MSATTVTLHTSAEVTASGSATGVDVWGATDSVETRRAAKLQLVVTALAGGASLTVTVESSDDNTNWTQVGSFTAAAAVGNQTKWVETLRRYVRVSWTLTGASCTFAVTGKAHPTYATLEDLEDFALPKDLLDTIDQELRIKQLVAATSTAFGYLGQRTSATVLSVGIEMTQAVCRLVAWDLVVHALGIDQAAESHQALMGAKAGALEWLGKVATGAVAVEYVDTTHDGETDEEREGILAIASHTTRGWNKACFP